MIYFMIFCSITSFSALTICLKLFNRDFMKNLASYFAYNFLLFSLTVAIVTIIGGGIKGFHTYTIVLGVSFGITINITLYSYMKAMETGPLSYTSLFFSLALIIPAFFGIVFWGEKVSIAQAFGLIMQLITLYLGSESPGKEVHRVNFRWLLFGFISFLGNGGLMALAKVHQRILPGREVTEFLIVAFGSGALISSLLFLWYNIKKNNQSII